MNVEVLTFQYGTATIVMFNRPGVAGVEISSRHHYTQTIRARELKF